tara:strand:+ start:449 stop:661 length:213 start_codon:yes stop_codon:yes gene_type:complete
MIIGKHKSWPMVIASKRINPIWLSGSLKISVKNLSEPYPKRKHPEIKPGDLVLLDSAHKITNRTKPSVQA